MPIAPSIDNFLHTHSADEAIVKVGKLLIARSILLAEKESTLIVKDRLNDDRIDFARGLKFSEGAEVPPPNSSWLGEYFRILVAGSSFDDFIGSIEKVTFVSFNYDRCIEQYLLYAARQYFAVSNEALSDVAEKIRVIHPHGSVGSLSVSSGIIRGFGDDLDSSELPNVAKQIKTFTEGNTDSNLNDDIHEAFEACDVAIFLGFSYLPLNMKLLTGSNHYEIPYIIGTSLGISANSSGIIENELFEYLMAGDPFLDPEEMSEQRRPWLSPVTCRALFDQYNRFLLGSSA